MSDDDLNTITGWLQSHGLVVDEAGKSLGRRPEFFAAAINSGCTALVPVI
jgi:hypothetical protein